MVYTAGHATLIVAVRVQTVEEKKHSQESGVHTDGPVTKQLTQNIFVLLSFQTLRDLVPKTLHQQVF